MNIRPLGDRVLIKKVEAEEMTKGGIVLPTQAKEEPQMAEILAVGPGEIVDGKRVEMEVQVGNKIYFAKYAGTEVKHEGTDYVILRQGDILAVVE